MFVFPQTPLQWTQFLTSRLVAAGTAQGLRTMIDDHTELESDSFAVKAGTLVVGELVADQASPVTDAAVEKVWNWAASKKAARKARKNAEKE